MKRIFVIFLVMLGIVSCEKPLSPTGANLKIKKASTTITTNVPSHTIEQENIIEHHRRDNLPGSTKHLYVISAESGQVIIYSTVIGKVTSSGKRLTPLTVNNDIVHNAPTSTYRRVVIKNTSYVTDEVIQDDETFGSSIEYLYWFDSKGTYHQHYKGGNEILHISDQPLAVKNIILNLEAQI